MALEETLGAVRGQVGSLRTLVARTQAASLALKERLRSEPSAAATEEDRVVVEPSAARSCPDGCERHGNCNALTGECSCSLTHRGAACEAPTMPACELDAEGHVINLSLLASESFWWQLRDVRVGEERRTKPLHRWVGVVPCACVREAVAAFSLQSTPSPAEWPEHIGHLELALQRVVCVVTPLAAGALWEHGGEQGLRYSYVPVVAWLKSYPAHSPQLLAEGLVHEEDYLRPKAAHLMRLPSRRPAPPALPPLELGSVLPQLGQLTLLPLRRCGARRCHLAGWCGQWVSAAAAARQARPGSGPAVAACHCLAAMHGEGEAVRREPRRFSPRHDPGECAPPAAERWREGDERPRRAREAHEIARFDAVHDRLGADRWRVAQPTKPRTKACPNQCLGRGVCAFGFCHCAKGYWGLDCGLSLPRAQQLAAETRRPRIYVYEVPSALRRSCGTWALPEDLSDRLLLSPYLEPSPERADLFWLYGCPNGDTVLPALRWLKRALPFWNASVREGRARHVVVVGHEEGWAEVWQLLGRWLAGNGDHANHLHGWDDLHPASASRQIASIQLSGLSDYAAPGGARPIRGVSPGAPCRVCFQPGKDVMVPGYPGVMDYPDDEGLPAFAYLFEGQPSVPRRARLSDCQRIATARPYLRGGKQLAPRHLSPRVFFSGAVQTKTRGPGLYEPSRLLLYLCHKNRSKEQDFIVRQTESVTVSVSPWEVERPVDPMPLLRHASMCVVPEGKIGSYGHRSLMALMMGCVPLLTKERYSFNFFHEVLEWRNLSVHVPPMRVPELARLLDEADAHQHVEAMRRAATPLRRRLLWASIYGSCHLGEGEGGDLDAFDTLMEVLRRPRTHFELSAVHSAPRAPEMLDELYPALRKLHHPECTQGYQCFDKHRRSCFP